jgi:hypothetical protein
MRIDCLAHYFQGFTIELTESCDDSILSPLIAATNTFATNLATCTTLFSLYPYLLRNKRALEGWHPTPVRKAVTIGRRGYRSSFSTASWDAACGWNCPVKWRYVKDVKGVGVFHWGGSTNQHDDDSFVGVPVTDNHMKWRLGDTCTNKNCPWNRANYFANRHSA